MPDAPHSGPTGVHGAPRSRGIRPPGQNAQGGRRVPAIARLFALVLLSGFAPLPHAVWNWSLPWEPTRRPAGLQAQENSPQPAPENKNPPNPASAWYDVETRNGRAVLDLHAVDGFRSRLVIYPAQESGRDLLLFIPDVYTSSFDRMQYLMGEFHSDFHTALLIPRGHRPMLFSPFARGPVLARDLTGNLNDALGFLNDVHAALDALRENSKELKLRPQRTCVVAGDFFSNLMLYDPPAVDCFVLLSPNRTFYTAELLPRARDRLRNPALLVAAEYYREQLSDLATGLPRGALVLRSAAGNGYRMLDRKPELIAEIKKFALDPEQYVQNARAGDTRPTP